MTDVERAIFVNDFINRMVKETDDFPEAMAALELVITAYLLVTHKFWKCSPSVAVEAVELALQRAVEHFANSQSR